MPLHRIKTTTKKVLRILPLLTAGLLAALWLVADELPPANVAVGQNAAGQRSAREGRSATVFSGMPHRSPLSVAMHPAGRLCATANHTAGSVSLVDWKTGKILCEVRCGKGPVDLIWLDEYHLVVSLLHEDAVALLRYNTAAQSLTVEKRLTVGDEPRGVALRKSRNQKERPLIFVAATGSDAVAVIDAARWQVIRRLLVGGHPKTVAVSPDGNWLVTCCNVPGQVWVHHTQTFRLLSKRPVFDDGFNLGRPVFPAGSSQVVFPHQINRTFPVHADNIAKGWVIDNRLTRLPIPTGEYWRQKQINLDVRGRGAGDANAVAFSPDGRWIVVSCGGTHELLLIQRRHFHWPPADPGDLAPPELRETEGALRRVKTGGRPVDVRFLDDRRVIVANYLADALQIVDIPQGRITKTIFLGGPKTPGLVRRGEIIFYDAERSLDGWFSCHTCHTDGHTSGQTFDTLNDGNFDTYKLVPSLRGVTQTGPWTWHGWQKSLAASLRKSLRTTLHTEQEPSAEDIRALLAYLGSLSFPASPFQPVEKKGKAAVRRGRRLFAGKAGCVHCHAPPTFTTPATYAVGLESPRYFYREFNPPSLRGLPARRRFLHDGRADSLKAVLTRYHPAEKTGGEKLTADEIDDLVAYLKSL